MKARSISGIIVLANAAQQLTEGKPLKATPISYSEAMILARLDGRKRMTRRLVQPQPEYIEWFEHQAGWCGGFGPDAGSRSNPNRMIPCPYGSEGDYLWIREEHRILKLSEKEMTAKVQYRADGKTQTVTITHADLARIKQRVTPLDQWMRARFMLQSFCRALDKVTAIRVERLQDITPEDALAEGSYLDRCPCMPRRADRTPLDTMFRQTGCRDHGKEFRHLWESINGQGSWEANSWVWVVSFEPVILP